MYIHDCRSIIIGYVLSTTKSASMIKPHVHHLITIATCSCIYVLWEVSVIEGCLHCVECSTSNGKPSIIYAYIVQSLIHKVTPLCIILYLLSITNINFSASMKHFPAYIYIVFWLMPEKGGWGGGPKLGCF